MASGAQSTAAVAERETAETEPAGRASGGRAPGGRFELPDAGEAALAAAQTPAATEAPGTGPLPSTGTGAQPSTGTGRGLRVPAMSPWARAGLLTLGGVLIAIGIAGLVLPGIQGIVTIVAGLVVVSLGSHTAHRWTRRGLRRWPFALDKYEKMRRSLRRRFHRRKRR